LRFKRQETGYDDRERLMQTRKSHRLRKTATFALAVALVATACGGDEAAEPEAAEDAVDGEDTEEAADGEAAEEPADPDSLIPVTFQLNWVPGGFNAGFAVARERGYYEDEGLFVSIVPGNGSGTTAQLAAAGNAPIAYADVTPVSQLIAEGAPLTVVSTLYQAPPAQVTALTSSGIEEIEDIAGRSVATATGAAETPVLPLLLEANGIDPDDVDLIGTPREALVPQLMEGNVDAILGSMDFYSIQLEELGAETVDFPFHEYGVGTVSTSIFVENSYLDENPEVVRSFVRASLRGWAESLEDPAGAIDDVVALFPDVDPDEALEQLEATATLFCANEAEYIGKAPVEAWERHQEVLETVDSLPEGIDPTDYYSYDYLPEDSDLTPCS
jgi:NitT/TauT family transport system substrate-binding protein